MCESNSEDMCELRKYLGSICIIVLLDICNVIMHVICIHIYIYICCIFCFTGFLHYTLHTNVSNPSFANVRYLHFCQQATFLFDAFVDVYSI